MTKITYIENFKRNHTFLSLNMSKIAFFVESGEALPQPALVRENRGVS